MTKVTVYSTDYCPYCVSAKRLLAARGIAFEEINVEGDDEKRRWLIQATGQRTVPQIFFGERSIGGFQELAGLDRTVGLAKALAEA